MDPDIKEESQFITAKKLGNVPGLMDKFTVSPAFTIIVDFIKELQPRQSSAGSHSLAESTRSRSSPCKFFILL